jgi:hypothetical protein
MLGGIQGLYTPGIYQQGGSLCFSRSHESHSNGMAKVELSLGCLASYVPSTRTALRHLLSNSDSKDHGLWLIVDWRLTSNR